MDADMTRFPFARPASRALVDRRHAPRGVRGRPRNAPRENRAATTEVIGGKLG
jgi:hypothetical protein